MQQIARDPGLHNLSCVVDFFDNHKTGITAPKNKKTKDKAKKRKG